MIDLKGDAMRKLVAIGLVGLIVLGACTSKGKTNVVATQAASTSPSPSTAFQIHEQVVAAIRAAGSFHLTGSSKLAGQTATYVQDVGLIQGTQDVSVGAAHMSIRVIKDVAYLRANRAAMTNLLKFPAAIVTKYHDRWISFTSADPGYTDIASDLTLESAITDIAVTGTVSKTAVTTVLGQQVFGLSGGAKAGGTETLYVPVSGTLLPVQSRATNKGESLVLIFSQWGERVLVATPTGVTPFSSIVGSSGGTGA